MFKAGENRLFYYIHENLFMKLSIRLLCIVSLCFNTGGQAQPDLSYNKRFVQSEDRWVAFKAGEDSTHPYGFIYIDAQAGLTLQYEGNFKTGRDGRLVKTKINENGTVKVRLEPNQVQVAWLPENIVRELGHDWVPDWLKNYKETTDTLARMVRWGYFYNHWGESQKALSYLEPVYRLQPETKSVEFELSFAYNALGRYNEALVVLEKAVKRNPEECLLYKELSYAQIYLNKTEEAIASCRSGIQYCTEKNMKAEIAYNMAYTFYKNKDKSRFEEWAAETRKWADTGSVFDKNLGIMEKNLN